MLIRFIYAYAWKSTGIPCYVGSAWDPAARDRQHSKQTVLPIDRLLREHGRKAFTLMIC